MQLRDRIRTESVLQRLSWRLGWSMVPARQQRQIVRELRSGLREAAEAGHLDDALARLASTRELADAYVEALEPRARWAAGVLWAAVGLTTAILATIVLAAAFGAGLREAGVADGTYELWPGFAFGGGALHTVALDAAGRTVTGTFALGTPLHLAALVLGFVAGSRPWRALRQHR